MSKFRCVGCGLCCTKVGDWLSQEFPAGSAFRKPARDFPYKTDKKGRCEKLNDDLSCSVYDQRPLLCRVDEMFPMIKFKGETLNQYYDRTEQICRKLMQNDGQTDQEIDEKYAIL